MSLRLRFYAASLIFLSLAAYAAAQVPMTGAGKSAPGGGGGVCAEATSFIARTSGTSGTDQTNYANLICGLVTDSAWTGIDVLQVYAADSSGNGLLNLKSSSFTGTLNGSPAFTAYRGFTGDGNNAYIATNFNASTAGGSYTQNAASLGAWDVSTTSSQTGRGIVGLDNFGGGQNIFPKFNGTDTYIRVNDNSGAIVLGGGDPSGFWFGARTSSTGRTGYRNGASIGSYGSVSSISLPNESMIVLGNAPFAVADQQVAAFIAGGNLDSVQGAIYTRLRTYMTAVGVP